MAGIPQDLCRCGFVVVLLLLVLVLVLVLVLLLFLVVVSGGGVVDGGSVAVVSCGCLFWSCCW